MTNVSGKDDNGYSGVWGVSHLDGVTPVQIKFNSSTRGMLIDTVTTIGFSAGVSASMNGFGYPLAKATSSSDNTTVLPWVVNATTGAVLIDLI